MKRHFEDVDGLKWLTLFGEWTATILASLLTSFDYWVPCFYRFGWIDFIDERFGAAAPRLEKARFFFPFLLWSQIKQDDPLNLSISISGGKETNRDSLSKGE